MWSCVIWLDMRVCLFGTNVTQIIHTKNGWGKKRPLNLVYWYDIKYKKPRKWYEIRSIWCTTKQPRHKIQDGKHKTQGTRFLPGTDMIWDSGSKIQDPKTLQHCINPTFRLFIWAVAVLQFSHRHGQSHTPEYHMSSATPQPQEMNYDYERQPHDRQRSLMRLTIEFWPVIN